MPAHSADTHSKPRLRSVRRRGTTICAVLGIHVLLWPALLVTTQRPVATPPGARPDSIQLLILQLPLPEPPREEQPADEAQFPAPAESPGVTQAFVATDPRERPGDQVPYGNADPVVEETALDVEALGSACARAYPESAGDLHLPGTVTLLVRVEPSGRPSEVKIVAPSGSDGLDEAVAACLMSLGEFTAIAADGRAVASWRRLQWSSARRSTSPPGA